MRHIPDLARAWFVREKMQQYPRNFDPEAHRGFRPRSLGRIFRTMLLMLQSRPRAPQVVVPNFRNMHRALSQAREFNDQQWSAIVLYSWALWVAYKNPSPQDILKKSRPLGAAHLHERVRTRKEAEILLHQCRLIVISHLSNSYHDVWVKFFVNPSRESDGNFPENVSKIQCIATIIAIKFDL